MMWGYGFGLGWFMMAVSMVLWTALLVVLAWALIRWLGGRINMLSLQGPATPTNGPSALEILCQRYARGEIDTATFEQMREHLAASTCHEAPSRQP